MATLQQSRRDPARRFTGLPVLRVDSATVVEGAKMPVQHTADGINISPSLRWDGEPPATRSLAVICRDIDAPTRALVHWVLWGINPDDKRLEEDVAARAEGYGYHHGKNDFDKVGYSGPVLPDGEEHRYVFEVIALDTVLGLKEGVDVHELELAMEGHILATGRLTCRYGR
jgi:Raf kinase inhibitor-like YbhB/YbcL family protein